ncbi:histone H4 transcription factor [Trichoplusia ni]|uniref:Histone H4 transcription factor n=1 Tax=Trichoplusia ni TaxID=7111 RepID=A0A7E5VHH4_TRINI|nr:histone H4 transcription factor [Trichoplusia ni]
MANEVKSKSKSVSKTKLSRCMDWLQKQNDEDPMKLSLQNKNDIQFIIQTHAARKNFLLAVAEDDATVPNGIHEPSNEPKAVSLHKLRVDNLFMTCEWQSCESTFEDYNEYQKHVVKHASDAHAIEREAGVEYVCLWDVCGHKTNDFNEMIRHINYHAYHGKLLAIGFNGRATLKLARCKKDSSKRNHLPKQTGDYVCMWINCDQKYNSMQHFLDHVKVHTNYSENYLCSWAGCGAVFPRKEMLVVHVRSHTGERLIACYHCGQHFANNRKLSDHLRRQNVYQNSPFVCELCGTRCATEYLLNEHTRQHVSTYACTMCDMSVPSPNALAKHVRYRHLTGTGTRPYACPHCPYRAVTRWDVRKHIETHKRKKDKEVKDESDDDLSDDDSVSQKSKRKKSLKKYACHMCPEKNMKIFSRGNRLTTHLVKVHGAQWSAGHSRFRYQLSEDGMYRLTTTRYESLEVSTKIMDGYSGPPESLSDADFKVRQVADATESTPTQFVVTLKNGDKENDESDRDIKPDLKNIKKDVEIMMCDVDEEGNIISTEVIVKSDVLGNL